LAFFALGFRILGPLGVAFVRDIVIFRLKGLCSLFLSGSLFFYRKCRVEFGVLDLGVFWRPTYDFRGALGGSVLRSLVDNFRGFAFGLKKIFSFNEKQLLGSGYSHRFGYMT
jgi:hypothetical protein